MLMIFGPLGALMALYLAATSGIGLAFLAFGLSLLPAGIYAYIDDMKVSQLDQEASKFLRSMGNVAESLGTTLSSAMTKIDRRSLGSLEPYVKRLQSRLRSRITPNLCWDRFMDETGSELIHRSTRMFVDGVSLGGSPERVGAVASDYAMSIALLRARRHVTALPFAYLTIPLHGAMTGLLIFVLEIMVAFNGKLNTATEELLAQGGNSAASIPNLHVFNPQDMSQTSLITMGAVIVLTVANTLAPKFATGGHRLKLAFYGSIMCTLTGINLIIIPPVAAMVLK